MGTGDAMMFASPQNKSTWDKWHQTLQTASWVSSSGVPQASGVLLLLWALGGPHPTSLALSIQPILKAVSAEGVEGGGGAQPCYG